MKLLYDCEPDFILEMVQKFHLGQCNLPLLQPFIPDPSLRVTPFPPIIRVQVSTDPVSTQFVQSMLAHEDSYLSTRIWDSSVMDYLYNSMLHWRTMS